MLFLRSSPVGAKDPTKSVAPTVLTLERAEIPRLAPGATYCRRSAASIGCASRVILDSIETRSSLINPAPGPRYNPLAPNLIRFRRDPLSFLQWLTKQYGDFARFWMGGQQMFFVNHPDYIRDVLVTYNSNFVKGRALQRAKRLLGQGLLTSEGDLHRRQRPLVQPAFHRQRIASYGSVMVAHADRASSRWRDGDTFDMSQEMTRLTLGIVAKTLFDADVESEADQIGEAMTCIMKMF